MMYSLKQKHVENLGRKLTIKLATLAIYHNYNWLFMLQRNLCFGQKRHFYLNVCEFYCERSELSGLFKGTDFLYIIMASEARFLVCSMARFFSLSLSLSLSIYIYIYIYMYISGRRVKHQYSVALQINSCRSETIALI